jgi:hypothetical protein
MHKEVAVRATFAGVSPPVSGPHGPVRRRRLLRLPSTRLGRLSLLLLGVAIALMVVPSVAVAAGVSSDSALILEIALIAVPLFASFATAIAAGVVAVVALFRGERSLLLTVPLLVGAFALMFAIGELTTPH